MFSTMAGFEGALIGVALIAFFIVRQFSTRKVVSAWTLVAPLALAYLGAQTVGRLDSTGWVLLALNLAVAVALGVLRAMSFRIWTSARGEALMRGTGLTLVLKPAGTLWRSLLGLGLMLVVIGQSSRSIQDQSRLVAVWLVAVSMSAAWLCMSSRFTALGVWLLGGLACVLMFLVPGNGAMIGVIAAIVVGALRLPVRHGAIAAAVLGGLFVLAHGLATTWAELTGLALSGVGVAFAYMATASVRRIREERVRAEALLEELQRTRSAEIEHAALAERTRIAREIHDVLAHTLSALAVQLEGTRMLLEQRPGDPAAVASVDRAHRLASEGLAEARRAVGALRGDRLPGTDGLAHLLDDFSEATGTPGRFKSSGVPIELSSERQLAIFRTAQEALTNVRKHARATSVEMRLRYALDGAELVVEDTAPAANENGTTAQGYGLVGMRERAELLGGTLDAGPVETGFRVRLWLPKQ